MATPTLSVKTRLSEFFRSRLNSTELPFFLNNADTDNAPPYGVITVTKIEETTPESNVFRADLKIAIIDSIDNSSSDAHDKLLESVFLKLKDIPRRIVDEASGIRMFGWTILYTEAITKEEAQSFSDVITIAAGCGG